MSRLATIVGVLSAIVSLADYLFARSFLSHWFERQVAHDGDGWRISPTLNLFFIVGLVALIWLVTESPAGEPEARKRLFRLRANLVVGSLAAWFFFGPAIGDTDRPRPSPPATVQNVPTAHGEQPVISGLGQPGQASPAGLSPSHALTSQFTWKRPATPPERSWRPGDGLRAMARMLEDATGVPPAPQR